MSQWVALSFEKVALLVTVPQTCQTCPSSPCLQRDPLVLRLLINDPKTHHCYNKTAHNAKGTANALNTYRAVFKNYYFDIVTPIKRKKSNVTFQLLRLIKTAV